MRIASSSLSTSVPAKRSAGTTTIRSGRARATDSAGEIEVRLAIAHEQLRERDQFDIAIINDDAERATDELQERLDALLDADSVKGSE